ncbi:MAG: hypothetical protein NTY69_03875 [Methylococcales bacterium]|nr:hypothetical protein [Methylococcales bacterium]
MFEIAGGIIIAVLFFVFLPLVLEIGKWVIGIGLIIAVLITVGVGIFILSKNDPNNFFFIMVFFIIIFIVHSSDEKRPWGKDVDHIITINQTISSQRKNYIINTLLKTDGINSITIDGVNIRVNFKTNKTSLKKIKITIDELLFKDRIE